MSDANFSWESVVVMRLPVLGRSVDTVRSMTQFGAALPDAHLRELTVLPNDDEAALQAKDPPHE